MTYDLPTDVTAGRRNHPALLNQTNVAVNDLDDRVTTVEGTAAAAVPSTRQIIAGTGLTGGGTLAADRTLAVSYGTSTGTAAQGNDSRITGAIQGTLVDAKGDVLTATADNTPARLGVGTDGQVLTADSTQATGLKWSSAPGGGIPATIVDVKGDIIAATAADTVARVAVGTDGQVLTADSTQATGVKWAAASAGAIPASTVDAKGDLLAGTANDTVARLAVGTDGQVLVAASGQTTGLQWQSLATAGAVVASTIDAKGDLLAGTADNTIARVAVGSNDYVLTADSAQTPGLKWGPPRRIVEVRMVDSATALATMTDAPTFVVPPSMNGLNLIAVGLAVDTSSSSGLPTAQIRNITDATNMLSTALTIDTGELTSYTAATAAVINTATDDIATGDRLGITVSAAGTGTKGLVVIMEFGL